jgi:hypothetical protein
MTPPIIAEGESLAATNAVSVRSDNNSTDKKGTTK